MQRIVNIDEVELEPRPERFRPSGEAGDRFDARMGLIAQRLGAQKLGYNITALPPGKRAFPLHCHLANEEMFFILEGQGQIRIGDATYPIRTGDIIACPPGGRDTAHQIVNTGDAELKFLAVSTRLSPEICEYPDSDKYAVFCELPPGADGKPGMFRVVGRPGNSLDYWEGE